MSEAEAGSEREQMKTRVTATPRTGDQRHSLVQKNKKKQAKLKERKTMSTALQPLNREQRCRHGHLLAQVSGAGREGKKDGREESRRRGHGDEERSYGE